MTSRNLFSMVVVLLLASCANNPVGERHTDLARRACPIGWEHCSMQWSKENWALEGSYTIEKTDVDRFRVDGQIKVDTSQMLSAYTHSRVIITFYFFRDNEIVARLNVTARGKANEFNEFSKTLVTDKGPDSSTYGFSKINVSEVPL